MVAKIEISADFDVAEILKLAGSPADCEPVLSGSTLYVAGVSQQALNSALVSYDHAITLDRIEREAFKRSRADAVAQIVIVTAAGNSFDGDEISQGRMARAILGLNASGESATVTWVLADNTVIQVTAAELYEVLALAGKKQAELWIAS